ncbi:MAG: hypothetical protein NXH73_04150 [Flavobacteriaceae bacterium]|nr:hypothetical protein [Flavobacteriaceae bacterium]
MNQSKLILINFTIVVYFIVLWLIDYYKIDTVLIGVFKELLTIPFLIAQLVFLIVGIKYVFSYQKEFIFIISVLLLAICVVISVGSFFW